MLQLKEALDQRMGCVIVGPSGCGKSTLWSILRHAMVKCGQAVNTHVVNPKSMPRQVRCRSYRWWCSCSGVARPHTVTVL